MKYFTAICFIFFGLISSAYVSAEEEEKISTFVMHFPGYTEVMKVKFKGQEYEVLEVKTIKKN